MPLDAPLMTTRRQDSGCEMWDSVKSSVAVLPNPKFCIFNPDFASMFFANRCVFFAHFLDDFIEHAYGVFRLQSTDGVFTIDDQRRCAFDVVSAYHLLGEFYLAGRVETIGNLKSFAIHAILADKFTDRI